MNEEHDFLRPDFYPVMTEAATLKKGDTILYDEKRGGISEHRVLEVNKVSDSRIQIQLRHLDDLSVRNVVSEFDRVFYTIQHHGHRKLFIEQNDSDE